MNLKTRFVQSISHPARALAVLLLLTLFTHLPTGFGSFVGDDYMQWAMLKGSLQLQELGFAKADPAKPLLQKLQDGFHFFSAESGSLAAQKQYGNVLWWSGDDISMVPFRPLAAFTHWIDYTFFGDQLWLHQLHSLLYFLLLTWLLYRVYRVTIETDNTPETDNTSERTFLQATAFLATLLFVVDFSLTRSFAWVVARNSYLACAIGIASLLCFIRWRREQHAGFLLLSLLLFVLALLTAEAALAVAAYMGAYVLCIEKQSLPRKVLPLLPVIAVILLWRGAYDAGGFGALNIGQYVDPGRSPKDFLLNFVSVFPLIAFSQISGIDTLIMYVHPQQQWQLVALGWLVAVGGVWLIWPLLKANASDRFWFVGSLVAAIPGTALISAESRTVTFSAIGFFYLLAKWLVHLYRQRQRWLPRWTFRLVLGWHGVLPLLIAVVMTSGVSGFSQLSKQNQSVAEAIVPGQTGLVVVNPDSSGMMFYLPFEWAFRGFAVPGHVSVLGTGLETLDLTRVSEREFLLAAPAGMPLHHKAPVWPLQGKPPGMSALYSGLYTQSFFVKPQNAPQVGQVIAYSDLQISILEANDVGPTKVRIEFTGSESPDRKVWQWYDWQSRPTQYRRMEALAIGETRRFEGPLDAKRALRQDPSGSADTPIQP